MKRTLLGGCLFILAGTMIASAAIISGTVSDSAGAKLKGITVSLQTTTTAVGTTLATATTDSLGAFSVTCDSTTGKYVLKSVSPTSAYITQYDSLTLNGTAKTINIKMAKVKSYSISGTVTDSTSGALITGAIVGIFFGAADTTAADGKYSLDSMKSGASFLTVSAPGYSSIFLLDTIRDASQTINFKLTKLQFSTISGKVSDSASGAAIAGAIVSFTSMTDFKTRTDTSNTDGSYSLDSISASAKKTYYSVSATGYNTTIDSILIDSATPHTINLKLTKAIYYSISGKISDSVSGQAILGASVVLMKFQGTAFITIDSVVTDANGNYTVDSASAGASLVVSATGLTYPKYVQLPQWTTSAPEILNVLIYRNVGVLMNSHVIRSNQTISVSADHLLLKNMPEPGIIRLFNAKGEMIFSREFRAGNAILMNFKNKIPFGAYVLTIHQKSATLSNLITIR